ncbi:MAG: alpha/beta fold hydrolase [Gemmataceae bacterium]
MQVDLVHTATRDGLRLDGIFQASSATHPALDAALCLHGTGSNFYGSTLFDALAARLLESGISVLRVNTRGHDLMSNAAQVRGGGRRAGASHEILDDCRHDVAAWCDWLRGQWRSRLVLIGHSSGAVKALYAQALEPDAHVRALVALSPPRLSYSWFRASDRAMTFNQTFQQAQALVQAGEPHALLEVTVPLPFVVTASGYLEKYGPDERYNYLRFLDRLTVPTLVTLGEVEMGNNMAFRDAPEAIRQVAPPVQMATIAGADHFYSGVRDELIATVLGWLQRLPS